MASSMIRNEIQEAVREEVSRLLGGSSTNKIRRDNETDTRLTTQSCQPIESSTSSNSSGSRMTSGSNTLSFEDFYKLRKRDRQRGFKPSSKKKKKSSATVSTPKKVVDVKIKVGVAAQSDDSIKIRHGKMLFVSVSTEADREEIIRKAVARHASFDQAFNETLTYLLLYPDFRKVQVIPRTTELLKLSKYKEAIAKDYNRLMLYLILLDDMEECDSDDKQAPHWSSFGFLRTGIPTTTLVLPKPKNDVNSELPDTSSRGSVESSSNTSTSTTGKD